MVREKPEWQGSRSSGLFLFLEFVSIAVIQYPEQKQLREGKGLFDLQFQVTVNHFGKVRVGTPSSS